MNSPEFVLVSFCWCLKWYDGKVNMHTYLTTYFNHYGVCSIRNSKAGFVSRFHAAIFNRVFHICVNSNDWTSSLYQMLARKPTFMVYWYIQFSINCDLSYVEDNFKRVNFFVSYFVIFIYFQPVKPTHLQNQFLVRTFHGHMTIINSCIILKLAKWLNLWITWLMALSSFCMARGTIIILHGTLRECLMGPNTSVEHTTCPRDCLT